VRQELAQEKIQVGKDFVPTLVRELSMAILAVHPESPAALNVERKDWTVVQQLYHQDVKEA
jgi:hypothetical protein